VKVSIATTLHRSRGGQFALHAMALAGNPYGGHTLATVIPDMEKAIGNGITRILADAGFNFRLLLNWLRLLLCLIVSAILPRS
jgi:IS5 family transposase